MHEVLGSMQHTGIGPSGSDKEPELGSGRLRAQLTGITGNRSPQHVHCEPT